MAPGTYRPTYSEGYRRAPPRREGGGGGDRPPGSSGRQDDSSSGAPSRNGSHSNRRPSRDDFRERPPSPAYNPHRSYPDARRDRDRDRDFDRDRDRDRRNSWHPQEPPRPPQGDFTFRVDKPPGISDYHPDPYSHPPPGPNKRQRSDTRDYDRGYDGDHRNRRRGAASNRGYQQRGRGRGGYRPPERPHERALLRGRHSNVAEEVVNADGCRSYRDVDELTDDDEADMDISDRSDSEEDAGQPETKRARRGERQTESDDAVPKWSNPDPYTVLPPENDAARKKKDVVKLIRKARVDDAGAKAAASTDAADFISFDLDDDSDASQEKRSDEHSDVEATEWTPINEVSTVTGAANQSLPRPPNLTTSVSAPLPASLPPRPTFTGQSPLPLPTTSASDLGSRKRTVDDRIKPPAYGPLKKTSKMPVKGHLLKEWESCDGQNPCPWSLIDHSASPMIGVRLHKEIVDFYDFVRPRSFEHRMRSELVSHLRKAVKGIYYDADVLPFGSFMSELYLPTADMDLVICSKDFLRNGKAKYGHKKVLYRFKAMLISTSIANEDSIELIMGAKVPLVKYIDRVTGLRVDVSFERYDGVRAIQTFQAWKKEFPAMPILVTLLKHFLVMRGLNEPVNGGIGGFSVICLVVSMLQLMPQVQSRSLVPEHHLGEMLMEFFDLYGHQFDYRNVAIRLSPPGYVHKTQARTVVYKNQDRLSIIDPNNNTNDISGGASNTAVIFSEFRAAYRELKDKMMEASKGPTDWNSSLLYHVLGGNYESFRLQRDHLKQLHEQLIGPCSDD